MRNKKIILVCAAVLGVASYFAYRETAEDLTFTDKEPEPVMERVPEKPKPIPHFVAGRKLLVEKAKAVYEDRENPPAQKDMPLATKVSVTQLSENHDIRFPSVKASFASDLYACSSIECPASNALMTTNGFHIFKTSSSEFLKDKSKSLVTFDKDNKQYGIWERRIIIETISVIDLNKKLTTMKFESIEKPQPLLYIAEYGGELEELDGFLSELKSTAQVKDVRLEITYSRSRPN